jgi:hypothetical protein
LMKIKKCREERAGDDFSEIDYSVMLVLILFP